jgi:deoxyribonuclease-4
LDMGLRLGVHTSIAGGLHISIERAKKLGCNTVQIFSHNPRSWSVRDIKEEEIKEFKRLRELYNINPVYVHASYLINLASTNKAVSEKSTGLMIKEMEIAEELGADYVVLHPGSASDSEKEGMRRVMRNLEKVLKRDFGTGLLLENTAGERGDITSRIKDIAIILKAFYSSSLAGICIDTCHAFQAGYDITRQEGISEMFDEIEREIGLDRLKLIHMNDSKKGFRSGVDRHEHIGLGKIGLEGFMLLLGHKVISDIPIILETPKESDEDDLRNLATVKRLYSMKRDIEI